MRHQFIAFLGSSVERYRSIRIRIFFEWDFQVVAINTGTARKYQVLDMVVAAGFEDIEKADDIALDICLRVLDAIPNASLCRQMAYPVKFLAKKKPLQIGCIFYSQLYEGIIGMLVANDGFVIGYFLAFNASVLQAVQLELYVVIIVEVVQTHYIMSVLHQAFCQVEADKTCGACDEDFQWVLGI